MNILLISFEYPPYTPTGGIGTYMHHLTSFLMANGDKVTVFSALPGASEMKHVHAQNYDHYYLPADNNQEFKWKAVRFFDTYVTCNRVDVIESPEVGACAIEIKRKYPRIPLIVKLHTPGVLITRTARFHQPMSAKLRFVMGALLRGRIDLGYWAKKDRNRNHDEEYLICCMADKILSPSNALKEWAVQFWKINESKIEVVPNVFNVSDELFSMPIYDRKKWITFVGKLSILKGMINLTKAIPEILNSNSGYKIVLVGRDDVENGISMKAYMQKELAAFKDRVLFKGVLSSNELKEIYAQSAVCVFPSLWENYPTVILEAIAAGTPVVASRVGGIPEVIEHGKNGLLFNPKKYKQIVKAVSQILKNEKRRLQYADEARRGLLEKINQQSFNRRIRSAYRSCKLPTCIEEQ